MIPDILTPARSVILMDYKMPKGGIKPRLSISFSGGKTSAFMTRLLLEMFSETHEIVVTFANTGQEHWETLEFIRRCDERFGFNTVWLEAVVHHDERKSCTHKVVNYETADRDGKVFENVISKYGIPNKIFAICNREMKLNTMRSYIRSIGWKPNTYSIAVGIRADEVDRVSERGLAEGVIYPCADNGITKADIRAWWSCQDFNLNIPEHWGNCVTCFKKSDRKLLTVAKELPEAFAFNRKMEILHSHTGAGTGPGEPPRKFFRSNRTVAELFASQPPSFNPYTDDKFIPFDEDLDVGGGCGATCEIGADDVWTEDEDEDEDEFTI